MSTDPRDAALVAACPCVPVPRFGELADMQVGQRTLVARDGVFLQVRRSWLDCVLRIADLPATPPLPYGTVKARIAFSFGVIPLTLLHNFIEAGRAALPNEVAGGLIHCAKENSLRLEVHESISAGPGGVQYRMPRLADDEAIAVDLHTHGRLPAFWSSTDDRDDQGVKVCGVFGNLHDGEPSAAFRLAVNGRFIALPHPWQKRTSTEERGLEDDDRWPTLNSMGFVGADEWSI